MRDPQQRWIFTVMVVVASGTLGCSQINRREASLPKHGNELLAGSLEKEIWTTPVPAEYRLADFETTGLLRAIPFKARIPANLKLMKGNVVRTASGAKVSAVVLRVGNPRGVPIKAQGYDRGYILVDEDDNGSMINLSFTRGDWSLEMYCRWGKGNDSARREGLAVTKGIISSLEIRSPDK